MGKLFLVVSTIMCIHFFPLNVFAGSVVALDPGHGGSNQGADYLVNTDSKILEKDLTLELAKLIKIELEKEGVEVFLTRNEDVDMSLAERAEYACERNARFIISLHFNASERHTLYGTELWISSSETYFKTAFPIASHIEEELESLGLLSRGIKIKLNQENVDYYGIIREGTSRGLPTILVEHCFLDHERDISFWSTYEALESLARADARGIIEYLNSADQGPKASELISSIMPDSTPPEILKIYYKGTVNDNWVFQADIKETDSTLTYYSYAAASEEAWSELFPLYSDLAMPQLYTLEVPAELNTDELKFRIYNGYDLFSESYPVAVVSEITDLNPTFISEDILSYSDVVSDMHREYFLFICVLVGVFCCLVQLVISYFIIKKQKFVYFFASGYQSFFELWNSIPSTSVLTKDSTLRPALAHAFMLYVRRQSICYMDGYLKMGLRQHEIDAIARKDRLIAVPRGGISVADLFLVLNQLNVLDCVINMRDTLNTPERYEQLYYQLSTSLQKQIRYQREDFDKIAKEISLIFARREFAYAVRAAEHSDLNIADDDLYLLATIYVYIIRAMGNDESVHSFAGLVVLNESLRHDIFPFPVDTMQARRILSLPLNSARKIELLIELFGTEQAECINTVFLDVRIYTER